MEQDADAGGYTTLFRPYDEKLGRWKAVDPLAKNLPWQSPYVAMDDKPIIRNDVDGDCPTCVTGAVVGAITELVFQIGEHMLEGKGDAAMGGIAYEIIGGSSDRRPGSE